MPYKPSDQPVNVDLPAADTSKLPWEPPVLGRTSVEEVTAAGGGAGADSALGS